MKKVLGLFLCAALLMVPLLGLERAFSEGAPPEMVSFVDSVGRMVWLPGQIDKIAVSGILGQIVVFALSPEKLAGIAAPWDRSAALYLGEDALALPVLGQLYGGKTMNLESLIESGVQVVVDIGEPKETIARDLDGWQAQTGIPFVHISATLPTMGEAFRMLGALLRMPGEAGELAAYCEGVYARTLEITVGLKKVDILYLTGERGLNAIARGSYHAEVVDLLANNLAVLPDPSSRGAGNEVDMEQILVWNPEVILFSPDSIFASVAQDAIWGELDAIKSGRYYETPMGPYNWLGFPLSVQRCLGMMWMANLLYPEAAQYDLHEEVSEYFRLFYHCDLGEAQYRALIENSIGRRK